jgi:ATP-dependent DNA helicase PIF1
MNRQLLRGDESLLLQAWPVQAAVPGAAPGLPPGVKRGQLEDVEEVELPHVEPEPEPEPEPRESLVVAVTAHVEVSTPLDPVSIWPAPVPTFSYLAGPAGSGKTFLTKAWAEQDAGILLVATTGIAAINLGGETVNSVLGYFDTDSLQEAYINGSLSAKLGRLWKVGIKRLVLDEVSMLAGEQLTFLTQAIEEVNGRGYVLDSRGKRDREDDGPPPAMGLTLVGDFLQLPPVKATYAFESPEWEKYRPFTITLTEIRRQADPAFIAMLRAARAGRGELVAEYFQNRAAIQMETDNQFEGPTILARNEAVDRFNGLRMAQLPGKTITFSSARWGKLRSEWGTLEKPERTWGIPKTLTLKEGAVVMVLANHREGGVLTYVNGDLGTLVGSALELVTTPDGDETRVQVAYVRLQRSDEVTTVYPVERRVRLPSDSARRTELRRAGQAASLDGKWEVAGAISYMPLRVAYASTVHKSQGLSLDRVQVNIRDHFFKSPGMLYVALSRARTADGLRLVGSPQGIVEACKTDPKLRAWR